MIGNDPSVAIVTTARRNPSATARFMPQVPAAPATGPRPGRAAVAVALVGLAAAAWFAAGLAVEPPFVDEWAYVSQSYYCDLYARGALDDPAWLDYPAYDLPPLPKYAIGASLAVAGYRRPGPAAARAWYNDTSSTFGPDAMLDAARWPSVAHGALGCAAIFAIGRLVGGPREGLVAALLLAINPLYRMHARRAMSDVPAEAFLLASLAVGLVGMRAAVAGPRPWVGALLVAIVGGASAGLAILSKLNGGLALMVLSAWGALFAIAPGPTARRRVAVVVATLAAWPVAFLVFLAGNPFLTAQPPLPASSPAYLHAGRSIAERTKVVLDHRFTVSRRAQDLFPADATATLPAKAAAIAVQGFGRFGPLGPSRTDSTRRYDWGQDPGAIAWWPVVIAGAWVLARRARAAWVEDEPPMAAALLVYATVAIATVGAFLPLAWDRYFLSIQPPLALLGAAAIGAGIERLASAIRGRPAIGGAS